MMEVLGNEPNVLYQSIHGPQPKADDGEFGLTDQIGVRQAALGGLPRLRRGVGAGTDSSPLTARSTGPSPPPICP